MSRVRPRLIAQVLGLGLLLLAVAALAPATIAAPDSEPLAGAELIAATGPQAWSQLLSRIVPEPSRRPLPRSRFSQTRVVSLYGYPGVPVMGALGEGTPEDAARRTAALVKAHEPSSRGVRVTGALHLIVAVAEVAPGPDGTYLDRLDAAVIERYLAAAREHDLMLFLDVQVGWGDPLVEAQRLERFLKDPDVQLALDPEFATRPYGVAPGKVIGSLAASDVNRVQRYLAELVREHGLPPKMLVLHQFLETMLAHPETYESLPEVEVTIDMDGYGSRGSKVDYFEQFALSAYSERPAIKLFYRWDAPLLTPEELWGFAQPPGLVIYQ